MFEIVKTEIIKILGDLAKMSNEGKDTCEVSADLYMCPSDSIDKISTLKLKYFNKGVEIQVHDDKIIVNDNSNGSQEMIDEKVQTLVNTTSVNSDDDKSKCHEIEDINAAGFEDPDLISEFHDSLSDDAQRVLRIIMNAPDDYVEKYGDKIAKKYIGEYLNLTPKDIKLIWTELRLVYAVVIETPDLD